MPLPLSPRPRARLFVCCAALLIAALPREAAAQAKTWHRIATVTTQTANQLCYTNGTDIVCDSNAPTLSGTSIGIGSTAPVSSLDISKMTDALALPGGSSAQRPTAVNGMIRYNTGGVGSIEAYLNGAWTTLLNGAGGGSAAGSNGQVQFNNAGVLGASSNFVWDNTNGRVGIGTTGPGALLHLWGTGAPQMQISYDATHVTNIRTTSAGDLDLSPSSGVAYIGPYSTATGLYVAGSGSSATVGIGTNSLSTNNLGVYGSAAIGAGYVTTAAPTNGAIIQGNVGIGTTNPQAPLHVATSAAASAAGEEVLRLGATAPGGTPGSGGYIRFDNASGTEYGRIFSTSESNYNVGMAFYTFGNNALGERLRISAAGNVGIGTTSPSYPLHVLSSLNNIAKFSAPNANVYISQYSTGTAQISTDNDLFLATANPSAFHFMPGGIEKVRIDGSGNVGIGTTSPGSSLQVNGGAAIGYSTNTAAPSNGMLVSGQVGIGTASPAADVKADINGAAKVAGTGSETCASAADIGKFRYNASKGYFEICSP
jgi:hypothetical protein